MNKQQISIIIPLYNEEKRIENTLEKIKNFIKGKNIELIFVNDGSNDKTLEILREKNWNYKIISYEKNMGKGYAIKQGFKQANGDILFFMDGDLAIPLDYIEPFIAKINEGYDIVIGNKKKENYKNLFRKIASKTFNTILKIVLGLNFNDTQCGFKSFRKEIGKRLFSDLLENGFAFDAEILLRAKKYGYKIKELPVEWQEDIKNSSVHLWKDPFKMFFRILKIKKYVK